MSCHPGRLSLPSHDAISSFNAVHPERTAVRRVGCFSIGSDRAYFFKATQYARVDGIYVGRGGDTLGAGPATTARTWPSLAQADFTTVDAVLFMGEGHAFFFSGTQYARVDNIHVGRGGDTLGAGPSTIARTWPSLAQADFTTVDAVLPMGGGSAYFFSGTQYARVDNIHVGHGGDILGAGPATITRSWPSLAQAGFSTVDPSCQWAAGWRISLAETSTRVLITSILGVAAIPSVLDRRRSGIIGSPCARQDFGRRWTSWNVYSSIAFCWAVGIFSWTFEGTPVSFSGWWFARPSVAIYFSPALCQSDGTSLKIPRIRREPK